MPNKLGIQNQTILQEREADYATVRAFYLHHGFSRLPTETPTYALDLIKFSSLSVRVG